MGGQGAGRGTSVAGGWGFAAGWLAGSAIQLQMAELAPAAASWVALAGGLCLLLLGHVTRPAPARAAAATLAALALSFGLVNSTPTFTEHHLVTNGCSELLREVFGERIGSHARSAFGVAQIPLGACVEIELIAALK